jgi:hypothetical protein
LVTTSLSVEQPPSRAVSPETQLNEPNPRGESNAAIIESEQMITNTASVKLPMENPQPGRYVITVKTFAPEAVVVKKNVTIAAWREFSARATRNQP